MQPPDPFVLDRRAVRAAFDRASATYDAAAVLQTRVRTELLSRLDLVRIAPEVVVDLGCGTGQGARQLKDRYRGALVVALDPAAGMLREARRRSGWLRPLQRVCGDVFQLPFRQGAVSLMFRKVGTLKTYSSLGVLVTMKRPLSAGGSNSAPGFSTTPNGAYMAAPTLMPLWQAEHPLSMNRVSPAF